MDAKTLGNILKEDRQRRGMSQEEYCELLNKSKSAYGRIERGLVDLPLEEWNKLFILVGIKPQEHPLKIVPVVKTPLIKRKFWLWPIGFLIWETGFYSIVRNDTGPWDFLLMAFVIACGPVVWFWWNWRPPLPTKEQIAMIKAAPRKFAAKVKETYHLWLP